MKPVVAIVGRPNVGKSTLFNRITKTRNAIVDRLSGITRDRNLGYVVWNDIAFTIVDTGGFLEDDCDVFATNIKYQVESAIVDADFIVMVLDGLSGLSPFDLDIFGLLRLSHKPIFYIINKIDGPRNEDRINDFYALGGVKEFYSVSAEHGYGISTFLDDLVKLFPSNVTIKNKKYSARVAVVGKPNAGKSSLINYILNNKRMVVSDIPGTTRDSIDSEAIVNGKTYLMIDTAGIRRKNKVSERVEKFSVLKALKSLNNCDIALIVIDAKQGITDQDIRIAGYAYDRGCGAIFLINKWDLIDNRNGKALKRYQEKLKNSAKFLSFAPIVSVSATTGLRVKYIFKLVDDIYEQYSSRITTGYLNRIIKSAILDNEPSVYKGKRLKFYYTAQVTSKPPSIISFVNYPKAVHFSYKRYLINRIRKDTGLVSTPLKLSFNQRLSRKLI